MATLFGYTPREWEWIHDSRPLRLPRNVWGRPPGSYAEVMAEASDNSSAHQPTHPAPEHTAQIPAHLLEGLLMCACENAYVCERCRDTPDDPYYCDNTDPEPTGIVPITEASDGD